MSARRSTIAFVITLAFTTILVNDTMAIYLYDGEYDATQTTSAYVNLPINAQTNVVSGEHSLFEMSMSNAFGSSGDFIEIGITTDPLLNGDANPHWFVYSWVNGIGQGYDGSSHFVSNIGNFWTTPLTLLEGTSDRVGFVYSASNWNLYLSGTLAGYFPGSEFSGAFTITQVTQVFGEVFYTGGAYPTLNGTVSGYSSSGHGLLSPNVISNPYTQSNATGTGFIALGPVPEPSIWAMLVGGVGLLLAFRRKRISLRSSGLISR